jgi:FtsP/CotA-like multicopper oxidase with cupredoxin domain
MAFRRKLLFSANYPFPPTYTKNKRKYGVNQKVATGLSSVLNMKNHNSSSSNKMVNTIKNLQDRKPEHNTNNVKYYTFRLQQSLWDFGGNVGEAWALPYHQYLDPDGNVLPPDTPGGSWVPSIPGPTITGNIGDIICVTIQNRINNNDGHFVDSLKDTLIVHWHGVELANCYDGTPVTQTLIEAGTDFTYRFQLVRPGVFWYHSHWNSMIQNPLGANGAVICDDNTYTILRSHHIIPHKDRTFVISLSDMSFQDNREDATNNNYIPIKDITTTVPPPIGQYNAKDLYIRDIMNIGGGQFNQNFGDVILINGKHNVPYNRPGNTQEFWKKKVRNQTEPIVVQSGESMAFYITNNGMHRFYKIHLEYKTSVNGAWIRSENLFIIGGEGGLLDEAIQATGTFDNWKQKGIRQRHDDQGLQSIQTTSELSTGEFLLPTSARQFVAFHIESGWTSVALVASGFSVAHINKWSTDEDPNNMIIAIFEVGTDQSDPNFKLASNIENGILLRTNPVLGDNKNLLKDLRNAIVTNSFTGTTAELKAAGVPVPSSGKDIMLDYNITLDQVMNFKNLPTDTASSGPGQNGTIVHFNSKGPSQDTYNNTRYVRVGDIIEWTVETTTEHADHPWHTHGFSFQPIKMELKQIDGTYITLYEWDYVEYLDVIYVPAFHRVTYRFVVEDRPFIDSNNKLFPNGAIGRWLAHCPIFKHAHKGMMMEFIVVDENNSLQKRRFPEVSK